MVHCVCQDYCMAHPEEISKVAAVQKQVDDVKGVMLLNIEKCVCPATLHAQPVKSAHLLAAAACGSRAVKPTHATPTTLRLYRILHSEFGMYTSCSDDWQILGATVTMLFTAIMA